MKNLPANLRDAILARKKEIRYNEAYEAITQNKSYDDIYESYVKSYNGFTDEQLSDELKAFGLNYSKYSREEAIHIATKKISDQIVKAEENIQLIKNMASSHSTNVPLILRRSEHDDMFSKIKIGNKSIEELMEEALDWDNPDDFIKALNELIEKGNYQYTFERVAGTSLMGGWKPLSLNWRLHAPAGTKGMFLDALNTDFTSSEWEFLIAAGTQVKINKILLDEAGNWIIDATINVASKSGQTISKKIAIAQLLDTLGIDIPYNLDSLSLEALYNLASINGLYIEDSWDAKTHEVVVKYQYSNSTPGVYKAKEGDKINEHGYIFVFDGEKWVFDCYKENPEEK